MISNSAVKGIKANWTRHCKSWNFLHKFDHYSPRVSPTCTPTNILKRYKLWCSAWMHKGQRRGGTKTNVIDWNIFQQYLISPVFLLLKRPVVVLLDNKRSTWLQNVMCFVQLWLQIGRSMSLATLINHMKFGEDRIKCTQVTTTLCFIAKKALKQQKCPIKLSLLQIDSCIYKHNSELTCTVSRSPALAASRNL